MKQYRKAVTLDCCLAESDQPLVGNSLTCCSCAPNKGSCAPVVDMCEIRKSTDK
ncbi:hypothetical protein P9112_013115 [Eukaryota sp. TZLM1-RC]